MKIITLALLGASLVLATSTMASSGQEVTVRFDDIDRGPSDTLYIGGVRVSGYSSVIDDRAILPTPAATVKGVGLGTDGGIGAIGEVNNELHELNGQSFFDWQQVEEIRLDAPGSITSVTVQIHFHNGWLNPKMSVHDQLSLILFCGVSVFEYDIGPVKKDTLTVTFSLAPDRGYAESFNLVPLIAYLFEYQPPYDPFGEYRHSKEKVLQWGVSIVSMTYIMPVLP